MREERRRGEAPFSLSHLGGTQCQHDSLLVKLDHLVRVVSAGFLRCKLTAFPFAVRNVPLMQSAVNSKQHTLSMHQNVSDAARAIMLADSML